MELDPSSGTNDQPTTKTYQVEGDTITATRTDPYGFWYLKSTQGTLPSRYQGAYTSSYEVDKVIKEYTNQLLRDKELQAHKEVSFLATEVSKVKKTKKI